MIKKTLIIVALSLFMSACLPLPNLNWKAASESLSQTSKDLVIIKMAEEGLFPWYMNPYSIDLYSMDWMNFVMWDQMLHEMEAKMDSYRLESLLREMNFQDEYLESSNNYKNLDDKTFNLLVKSIAAEIIRKQKEEEVQKKIDAIMYSKEKPKLEKKLPPFPELFPACPELFPKEKLKFKQLLFLMKLIRNLLRGA